MCQWHIIGVIRMQNEGRRIDRLYNRLERRKRGATAVQAAVITAYQEYILGNYAQIRREQELLDEYFEQVGLVSAEILDDDEGDDD